MPRQPATLAAPRDDLSLAFVNTRYWRGRATPSETLVAPADLAAWWHGETGQHIAVPDAETFNAALDLRECLHRHFAARAQQRTPASGDVTALNKALAEAPARRTLALADGGLAWAVETPAAWATARATLLWSAADLLTGPRRGRVRECDNPECRYLFLDASKAGTRRWCDMSSCGNRAKAHRHYRKRQAELK
jgi:predicted RNA-binding Zn ribbon-like protein